MKVKLFAALFATTLVSGIANALPPVSASNVRIEATSQQGTQTVNAIYLGQRGLNNLLIRISNGYVVAYCSGRDSQGRQIWDEIQPVKIQPNNGSPATSDIQVSNAIRMKKNYAIIGQTTVYF